MSDKRPEDKNSKSGRGGVKDWLKILELSAEAAAKKKRQREVQLEIRATSTPRSTRSSTRGQEVQHVSLPYTKEKGPKQTVQQKQQTRRQEGKLKMATPEQLAVIREELRTQMAEAHEAELAALRAKEAEARLQAEQARQLLQADTVEARLARLELNQRAPVGGEELARRCRYKLSSRQWDNSDQ